MMSNLDMIIASIDDLPYVLGIALDSIIGRKILSGGNNKKGDNSITDTLYLPNGLVQMQNNISHDSKLMVNDGNLPDNEVLSDDLYNKLLKLADIHTGELDPLENSQFNKSLSKQTNSKPRLSITEKNKSKSKNRSNTSKNVTRNNKSK